MSMAASASLFRTRGSSMSREPLDPGLFRVVDKLFQCASGGGRPLDGGAFEAEKSHGHVPAPVHLANDFRLVDADVVEEDLVEGVSARGADDGAHLDARVGHVAEEEGYAAVLGGLGIGAGEHEESVGVVGAAGPDLLAVRSRSRHRLRRRGSGGRRGRSPSPAR